YRYEVAAGFCIMGSNQQPSSVGSCPFDPNFEDNKFVEIGETFDEAMKNLVKSFEQTAEGLFA
ncbi:MAG TPA: hypothetical protein VM260_05295, partial [Pirellula sp.]|nr:hypothetical protein [Pirellula sp.]